MFWLFRTGNRVVEGLPLDWPVSKDPGKSIFYYVWCENVCSAVRGCAYPEVILQHSPPELVAIFEQSFLSNLIPTLSCGRMKISKTSSAQIAPVLHNLL